jgi:glutaredoxin-related protein
MTDRTSMPSVWIGGSFVGGCNDGPGVVPLSKEGKLVPMLKQAGAL